MYSLGGLWAVVVEAVAGAHDIHRVRNVRRRVFLKPARARWHFEPLVVSGILTTTGGGSCDQKSWCGGNAASDTRRPFANAQLYYAPSDARWPFAKHNSSVVAENFLPAPLRSTALSIAKRVAPPYFSVSSIVWLHDDAGPASPAKVFSTRTHACACLGTAAVLLLLLLSLLSVLLHARVVS